MVPKHGPNEVGKRYNRLFVEEYLGKNKNRAAIYLCLCDCGNEVIVKGSSLRSGETQSCGCLQKESASKNIKAYNTSEERKQRTSPNKKHGMRNTKIYKIWEQMRRRCRDKKHQNYKYYGGRGIKVCNQWNSDFMSFFEWAIQNGYKDGLTIDRIDVNGNYEPNNCKWVPFEEQAMNKRNTITLEIDGEIKTLKDWCEIYDINYKLAHARYKKGWAHNEIFSKQTIAHQN